MPNTMSWVGTATGAPLEGDRMLLAESISTCASICASMESGTCTAIWSPSKSALNAVQTSGWISMALPSTRMGSKAWMPSRWRVGARFSSTGCSWMTSSRMSHTSGRSFSTYFLAALVELEVRAHHDHRAPGVVDALAEEVLPEATLLALQGVGERLQRAIVGPGDDAAPAAVVEQGVHRFLEHPLLVPDDDLGRPQLHEPLQAVVPVDHPPVEIVQVRGGEAAPVERHQRAQLGRNDRQHLEDHPFGLVAGLQERLDHLQPLHDLLPLLGRGLHAHAGAQLAGQRVQVHPAQQLADRLRAHARHEGIGTVLLVQLAHPVHREQVLLLEPRHLAGVHHHVLLEVEDLLELAQRHVEQLPDPGGQALEEPHVGDRGGQLDVAHALAAHPGPRHLDAALVTDHARELHPLVLAAGALVVLGRAEDAGAEEAVPLRLERPVVDGLRLLHLAVRPVANLLRRRELDTDRPEAERLRVTVQDAPQVLGRLVVAYQAAERPIRQHSMNLLTTASCRPSG